MPQPLPDLLVEPAVLAALAEDLGRAGDLTTEATIDADARARVVIAARQAGRIAGLAFARHAFRALDAEARFTTSIDDGGDVAPGDVIATIEAKTRALLSAERVALNFAGRLSGVASLTAQYVKLAEGTRARIVDTRKTTPGWRAFEKYAVRCGGGANHRFGLDDAILIKDNHIAAAGGVAAAIGRAKAYAGHMVKVECEVDNLTQLEEALAAGADIVLLDNMTPAMLRQAVEITKGRAKLEASGGVNLSTARAIAETGVDMISVGALTHSAPVLDIGLDFVAEL
ncbi:MAG: carboxylating nicotinate-nucleotide diphosphorylase [Alphaproteobacteria bacterium]|nr:carboxylating nicotinate-nucleotide diphosphorylase [Alphaproteobacteria bacterium]